MFSFLPPFAHAQFARQTSLLQPDTKIGGGDKKVKWFLGKPSCVFAKIEIAPDFPGKRPTYPAKEIIIHMLHAQSSQPKFEKKAKRRRLLSQKCNEGRFAQKRWRKQSPIGMLQKPLHPPQSDVLSVTPKEPWNKILRRQRCKSF